METLIWVGIVLCVSQSAMFSGLNLAYFSISRLRLEAEAASGNVQAKAILKLRQDSNFLLTTILWGNVGINVLLTLLSNSVLAGLSAFAFSTFIITFFGEILPQAYCSRRAQRVASLLAPLMRIYQFVLYPVARPSAWVLDRWLGAEEIGFFREHQLESIINQHIISDEAEVDELEGRGALNFLQIDDVPVSLEGEDVDPVSIVSLPVTIDLPIFPAVRREADDAFIRQINASGRKWVVVTNPDGQPELVLDADAYLRAALLDDGDVDPYRYCHRPIVLSDPDIPLGHVILNMRRDMAVNDDQAISKDIVLLWTDNLKKVITGADLLGRLLRGISA